MISFVNNVILTYISPEVPVKNKEPLLVIKMSRKTKRKDIIRPERKENILIMDSFKLFFRLSKHKRKTDITKGRLCGFIKIVNPLKIPDKIISNFLFEDIIYKYIESKEKKTKKDSASASLE